MKIALISGSAGDTHCGVGDYAYELAQHLALDAEVHLYFDRHHAPLRPPYEKLTTLSLRPLAGFSVFSMTRLTAELRDAGFDIVHIQYPGKGYGTSLGPSFLPQNLAGMRSRSRLVLTLHEWSSSHPLRKMAMDQMLPSIDTLIVSTEQEMALLQPRLGQRIVAVLPVGDVLSSQAELAAVWLAADGLPAPQPPPPAGPQARRPYSLFHYGLPAGGKGLERLLGALKLLRDAGTPAELILGGEYLPGDKRTEELLTLITDLNLVQAVQRIGHIPQEELARTAEQCWLGVFPFDEGFSSKRSSLAALSMLDLPLCVGAGSAETHPYFAPEENTAAALAVLLIDLFAGRLAQEWSAQVARQREYAQRFSFSRIARHHLELYERLRKVDV